jgi:choline dehydrogenase-like flavoprotein
VRQQVWGAIQSGSAAIRDCVTEVFAVTIDDGGGQEVQPSHAEVLTFGCPVADFALATYAEGVFQSVMGFACGTCRMGSDPARSVVNLEGRCHDLGNLWIADASVFPSCPAVGPGLTVIAHALRVAEQLRAVLG